MLSKLEQRRITNEAAMWCQGDPENPQAWEWLRVNVWSLIGKATVRMTTSQSCDADDLMQAGWFGVVRCVKNFDMSRGCFATIVFLAAKREMLREIYAMASPVKLPPNYCDPDSPNANTRELGRLATMASRSVPVSDLFWERLGVTSCPINEVIEADDAERCKARLESLLFRLEAISPTHAEVIRAIHGIGQAVETLTAFAARRGQSQTWIRETAQDARATLEAIAGGRNVQRIYSRKTCGPKQVKRRAVAMAQ